MKFLITAILVLSLSGCSLFRQSKKPSKKHFQKVKVDKQERRQFWSPCITIDFVDENFPEKLGEIIRVYDPKVSIEGAAEIVSMLLIKDKLENFEIKRNEVRTCFVKEEQGFSLKVEEVL